MRRNFRQYFQIYNTLGYLCYSLAPAHHADIPLPPQAPPAPAPPPPPDDDHNPTGSNKPEWEKAMKALQKVQGDSPVKPAKKETSAANNNQNVNPMMQNNQHANVYYQQMNMYQQQ